MVATVEEALAYARAQAARPSQDWTGYCQKFVRSSYGIGGGFASAWLQWLGLPDELRVEGGAPSDAPLGAPLFYKGSGPYGHVTLAARPLEDGTPGCWSNDLVSRGRIDHVARTRATSQWGQRYLGYGLSLNGVLLPVASRIHEPTPRPEVPYAGIGAAINNLRDARATARRQKDWPDARRISRQIVILTKLDDQLTKKGSR